MYGQVIRVEWLAPRMVRVVFDGDGLADFEPVPWTDQYVKRCSSPTARRIRRRSTSTRPERRRPGSGRSGAGTPCGRGTLSSGG